MDQVCFDVNFWVIGAVAYAMFAYAYGAYVLLEAKSVLSTGMGAVLLVLAPVWMPLWLLIMVAIAALVEALFD